MWAATCCRSPCIILFAPTAPQGAAPGFLSRGEGKGPATSPSRSGVLWNPGQVQALPSFPQLKDKNQGTKATNTGGRKWRREDSQGGAATGHGTDTDSTVLSFAEKVSRASEWTHEGSRAMTPRGR